MNSEERKRRLGLTIAFSILVFLVNLISLIVIGLLFFIAERTGRLEVWIGSSRSFPYFLVTAISCLITGTILTATLGRYPLRPVNKIISAMNRLASGDFHTRLHFDGRLGRINFIRDLTDSFNAMASELEGTEMFRADFVHNFSHEFKTPIVSIAGFAEILRKGKATPDEEQEYLEIIEYESKRLAAMSTNVLNLNRVESQKILSNVSRYNVSEQIRTCVLILEQKWSSKNLTIDLDFDEHFLQGEKMLLEQVWLNLIDNAIKFSPSNGSIDIYIHESNSSLYLAISNDGAEIPEAERELIFHKFYQGDRSHNTEGNGIGLALVKRVVKLHGGDISVSCDSGKVTFEVNLPIVPSTAYDTNFKKVL